MDIVVDTSALIAVIANEPEKPTLVELTSGADLIAPGSVHFEIGNAFSAMLRRRRITPAADGAGQTSGVRGWGWDANARCLSVFCCGGAPWPRPTL
jgi:hypothetical protein